ncbi:hypothetical protein [Endozoicomonas sp. SCSIO W0465]|uniref:hypothetical protein n=1 Tax=Endozoicomonas sp. SCSIO W0465 TaxID=2918516 RepID=UPI0020754AE8|nr:hypothetical protein [Endozoicomonas sp. SCSIO W0465]USE37574.1 hypothetical protein MJO57_05010 [Endozoicomonas sp. SCSIO W0465]
MLSNTTGVGGKSEILSGICAAEGIDRSGWSHASEVAVIGKRNGFTGLKIARYERRGRSLTIPAGQEEQEHDKDPGRRNDSVARSLRSRRIYPLQRFIRPFLFHPLLFRPHKLQRRCSSSSCSTHLPLSSHCLRTRVMVGLIVFVQTGKTAQRSQPVARRRRSLKATKKGKSPITKTVRKESDRPVGHGMIVGGKAIFPDNDRVFFQLCLDYYANYHANHANNANYPARRGTPSQCGPLQQPSCDRSCGDQAVALYSENNQDPVMGCSKGCAGQCGPGCWPEGAVEGKNPGEHPCSVKGSYFVGKDNDSGFVMVRTFRFGLWNIKLLTALLLLFLLITILDAFTGIRGYVSMVSPSALELLSGLIIALGMMAMALMVLCVMIK